MPSQYPSHVRFAVPALVALSFAACARSSLVEPDETALATTDDAGIVMEDAALGTKGDDAGVGTKDAGVGTKDAGEGIKDSGLPTKDSGLGSDDSGSEGDDDSGSAGNDSGTAGDDSGSTGNDAGTGTGDAGPPGDGGMTGNPDAGAGAACFACAEQKCAVQTNLCVSSPACVTEATCDLACLSAGKSAFATDRCIRSCTKNLQANLELISAVSCGITLCPQECLPILTSGGLP